MERWADTEILSLVPLTLVTALLGLAGWRFFWALSRPWKRLLFLPAFGFLCLFCAVQVNYLFWRHTTEGPWRCMTCYHVVRQVRLRYSDVRFPNPLLWQSERVIEGPGLEDEREQEEWFWNQVGIPHDHVYEPIGSHRFGFEVAQNGGDLEFRFQTVLRMLESRSVRLQLMQKWIDLDEAQKWLFRRSAEMPPPYEALMAGESIREEILIGCFADCIAYGY